MNSKQFSRTEIFRGYCLDLIHKDIKFNGAFDLIDPWGKVLQEDITFRRYADRAARVQWAWEYDEIANAMLESQAEAYYAALDAAEYELESIRTTRECECACGDAGCDGYGCPNPIWSHLQQ